MAKPFVVDSYACARTYDLNAIREQTTAGEVFSRLKSMDMGNDTLSAVVTRIRSASNILPFIPRKITVSISMHGDSILRVSMHAKRGLQSALMYHAEFRFCADADQSVYLSIYEDAMADILHAVFRLD